MFYAKGSIFSNLLLYSNYAGKSSMGLQCDIDIIELSTKVCLSSDVPNTVYSHYVARSLAAVLLCSDSLVSSDTAVCENYREI